MKRSRVKVHQKSTCRHCKRRLKYAQRFDMSVGPLNPMQTGNIGLPVHKMWDVRCWIGRAKLAFRSYWLNRGKRADY